MKILKKNAFILLAIAMLCNTGAQAYDKKVVVVDVNKFSVDETIFVASLQGIVARDRAQIYIGNFGYDFWIDKFIEQGYTIERIDDLSELIDMYKSKISCYVLSSEAKTSIAATVAARYGAVILSEKLASMSQFKDIRQIADVTNKDEEWLFEYVKANQEYFDLSNGILQHNPARPFTLIDFGIAKRMICIVGKDKVDLVKGFYSMIKPNTSRMGWAAPYGNEIKDVSLAAAFGLYTIPSSNTLNLSFLSSTKDRVKPKKQYDDIKNLRSGNVHYVNIIFSDGDNMNWHMGMANDDKYMSHPDCRKHPISWMYPPLLQQYAPIIYQYYRSHMPAGNYQLGGLSGIGYTYPSEHNHLADFSRQTDQILTRQKVDYLIVMDKNNFRGEQRTVIKSMFDNMPNIKGMYYFHFNQYERWKGDVVFIDGKPVVSAKYTLWLPFSPIEKVAESINNSHFDSSDIASYSTIIVHAWSYTMSDVSRFISLLDPKVELVNAGQFIKLIEKNIRR